MAIPKIKHSNFINNIFFLEYPVELKKVSKNNKYSKYYSIQNIWIDSFIKFLYENKKTKLKKTKSENDKSNDELLKNFSNILHNDLVLEFIDEFEEAVDLTALNLNLLENNVNKITDFEFIEFKKCTEQEIIKNIKEKMENMDEDLNNKLNDHENYLSIIDEQDEEELQQLRSIKKNITLENFNKNDYIEQIIEYAWDDFDEFKYKIPKLLLEDELEFSELILSARKFYYKEGIEIKFKKGKSKNTKKNFTILSRFRAPITIDYYNFYINILKTKINKDFNNVFILNNIINILYLIRNKQTKILYRFYKNKKVYMNNNKTFNSINKYLLKKLKFIKKNYLLKNIFSLKPNFNFTFFKTIKALIYNSTEINLLDLPNILQDINEIENDNNFSIYNFLFLTKETVDKHLLTFYTDLHEFTDEENNLNEDEDEINDIINNEEEIININNQDVNNEEIMTINNNNKYSNINIKTNELNNENIQITTVNKKITIIDKNNEIEDKNIIITSSDVDNYVLWSYNFFFIDIITQLNLILNKKIKYIKIKFNKFIEYNLKTFKLLFKFEFLNNNFKFNKTYTISAQHLIYQNLYIFNYFHKIRTIRLLNYIDKNKYTICWLFFHEIIINCKNIFFFFKIFKFEYNKFFFTINNYKKNLINLEKYNNINNLNNLKNWYEEDDEDEDNNSKFDYLKKKTFYNFDEDSFLDLTNNNNNFIPSNTSNYQFEENEECLEEEEEDYIPYNYPQRTTFANFADDVEEYDDEDDDDEDYDEDDEDFGIDVDDNFYEQQGSANAKGADDFTHIVWRMSLDMSKKITKTIPEYIAEQKKANKQKRRFKLAVKKLKKERLASIMEEIQYSKKKKYTKTDVIIIKPLCQKKLQPKKSLNNKTKKKKKLFKFVKKCMFKFISNNYFFNFLYIHFFYHNFFQNKKKIKIINIKDYNIINYFIKELQITDNLIKQLFENSNFYKNFSKFILFNNYKKINVQEYKFCIILSKLWFYTNNLILIDEMFNKNIFKKNNVNVNNDNNNFQENKELIDNTTFFSQYDVDIDFIDNKIKDKYNDEKENYFSDDSLFDDEDNIDNIDDEDEIDDVDDILIPDDDQDDEKDEDDESTFFFDFYNRRLSVFRNARKSHWTFFTTKKLNARRYNNFIKLFLKNNNNFLFEIVDYFTFKFKLSFLFWMDFINLYFFFLKKKIQYKQIYQFPLDTEFWTCLKKLNLKKLEVDDKIDLWAEKIIKIENTFWMEQKKNFPCFLKKKTYWNESIDNSIQYDFLTNYFIILKKYNFVTSSKSIIFKNKLLKLNNFRYKS